MATIYDAETGHTLEEGLQGSRSEMHDEAWQVAIIYDSHVILEDDDGVWAFDPDGSAHRIADAGEMWDGPTC